MTGRHPYDPQISRFISSLRRGDAVRLTEYEHSYDMTISRGPHLHEPSGGSPDSLGVIVSLGPGRFSIRVDVASIVSGRHRLERISPEVTP